MRGQYSFSMVVEPLGDSAYILRGLDTEPWRLAAALVGLDSVIDAVASYDTVGVYVDPFAFNVEEVKHLQIPHGSTAERVLHRVPVCYEIGLDLESVCTALNITSAVLIASHVGRCYECKAIGFTPGFPYLGYLSESISGLPRKPSPRVRVPAGSIGITGNQTGIYPSETPGGWNLIGITPLTICDPASDYFPISAGDKVEFFSVSESEYKSRLGERL